MALTVPQQIAAIRKAKEAAAAAAAKKAEPQLAQENVVQTQTKVSQSQTEFLAQNKDLRESAANGGRSGGDLVDASGQRIDRVDQYGAALPTTNNGKAGLDGTVTGEQKLAKDVALGQRSGLDIDALNKTAGSAQDFSFVNNEHPKFGENEDPKDYQIRVANWNRDQAIKQANAIAGATVGIRGMAEISQTKDTIGQFQNNAAGLDSFKKRIANPNFNLLTAEEKKINAQLPPEQQIQEYVELNESNLTADQKRAASRGRNIRFTQDQRDAMIDSQSRDRKINVIDPSTGTAVSTTIAEHTDRVRDFIGAEDGDVLDIRTDENGVTEYFLRDEEGEEVDPVKRAEGKLEADIQELREEKADSHRAEIDQIKNRHKKTDGTLTEQGIKELNKAQAKHNKDMANFEESAEENLDGYIRQEKDRQFAIDQRVVQIQAKQAEALDPMKQIEANARKEKVNRINTYLGEGYSNEEALIMAQKDLDSFSNPDELDKYDAFRESFVAGGSNVESVLSMAYEESGNIETSKKWAKQLGLPESMVNDQLSDWRTKNLGYNESDLLVKDIEEKVNGFFTGNISDGLALRKWADNAVENYGETWTATQLKAIETGVSADPIIQRLAGDLLNDSRFEVADTGGEYELRTVGGNLLRVNPKTGDFEKLFSNEEATTGRFTAEPPAAGFSSKTEEYAAMAQADPEAARKVEAIIRSTTGADLADIANSEASGFLRGRVIDLLGLKQQELLGDGDFKGLLKASAGGKPISDSTITKISKAKVTLSQLQGLGEALSDASQKTIKDEDGNDLDLSPITGWLSEKNPWDTDAQTIKNILNSTVPNLARGVYGEVGVLTDKDIAIYAQTIPNLKQTDDVKKAVMGITLRTVRDSIKTTLEDNAAAGRNVSGFIDNFDEINAQIKQIEDELGITEAAKTSFTESDVRQLGIAPSSFNPISQEDQKVFGYELNQNPGELGELLKMSGNDVQGVINFIKSESSAAPVDDIKDFDRVSTTIGDGVATGIENGSSYNKYGLDLVLDGGVGAEVKSPFSGKIVAVKSGYENTTGKPLADGMSQNNGWGNQVKIELADGRQVWVNHLASVADLKVGQSINEGFALGTQGNTGRTKGNTGVHVDITMLGSDGKKLGSKAVAQLLKTRKA